MTGTILSFELGLLWPGFMSAFGDVFGLGFALEAISFFVEAIFIAIYVYGWDRLSPRVHLLSGVPIALAGIAGSLMVLSVNAWMQSPSGFRLEGGRAAVAAATGMATSPGDLGDTGTFCFVSDFTRHRALEKEPWSFPISPLPRRTAATSAKPRWVRFTPLL